MTPDLPSREASLLAHEKDELVRQIRQAQARGKRARYAPLVRAAAIQYATERRAVSGSWRDISQELGTVASLVQRWISARGSRLLPVRLSRRRPRREQRILEPSCMDRAALTSKA